MLKLLTAVSAAFALQQSAPVLADLVPTGANPVLASAPIQDDSPFLGVILSTGGDSVVISEVVEGTAAQAAGLLAGDVLSMAGGIRVESDRDLLEAIGEAGVGGELVMVVQRGGQAVKVAALLGTRDQPLIEELVEEIEEVEPPAPGQRALAPVMPDARPFLGVNLGVADGGALVTSAIEGTAAANAGLLPGDLIVAFGGRSINSTDDLIEAVGRAGVGDTTSVTVQRDGNTLIFELVLGSRPSDGAERQLPSAGQFRVFVDSDGEISLDDPSGQFQGLTENSFSEEEWAEAWGEWEDEWNEEWGEWDEEWNGAWSEWDEDWDDWAQHWAEDMGQWVEEDWVVFGEGMETFGEDLERFGEDFEVQFEGFGEQLEGAFEGFERDLEDSIEEFVRQMERNAEQMAERLVERSEYMADDFGRRIEAAPRPDPQETEMLGRGMQEMALELERARAERDAAVDRAIQLESELAGVRSEVAELRAEVRTLIGYLEDLREN